MIYLIEDRKERSIRKQFEEELEKCLKDFDFFQEKKFIPDNPDDLAGYIQKEFPNAQVIIFHQTYGIFKKDNSKFTYETVKNAFKKIGTKHFISYTGGAHLNNIMKNDAIISAQTLYSDNLIQFLKYYKKNNEVNISLLVYGDKYLINEILNMSYLIHTYLTSNSDKIDYEDITDIIEEVIKSKELNDDKLKLLKWVNEKGNDLSKELLLKAIYKFISNYESNY